MPDGIVRIKVGLNTDTAVKDADRLGKEVQDTLNKVSTRELDSKTLTFIKNLTAASNRVQKLTRDLEAFGNKKIPTEEYSEIAKRLEKAKSEFDKFLIKQDEMTEKGQTSGKAWEEIDAKLEKLGTLIREDEAELKNLVDTGKAFTLGKDTYKYQDMANNLNIANQATNILLEKYNEMSSAQSNVAQSSEEMGKAEEQQADKTDKAEKSTNKATEALRKFNSALGSAGRSAFTSLGNALSKLGGMFKNLAHHTKDTNKNQLNLGKTVKKSLGLILRYVFGIRGLFMLFRKLRGYVTEAFKVMAQEIPEVNTAISNMGTAFKQLKASFGTAFQPLLQAIEPIITSVIEKLVHLMNYIARIFASLTGQNYIYEATVANYDYAKSAEAAEKANKGALASFDKLNVISKDSGKVSGLGLDKDSVKYAKTAIEPINFKTTKLYKSLEGVFKLIEKIGGTFKSIWEGGAGEEVISHLKGTFEGLIRIVNNLADSLANAWDKNEVGKSITKKIFDIFNKIWDTIESCVDATSRWAANLDFYPLLESIDGILGEISGILDPVLEMVEDLYINYLLPMGKWFVEKLAPALGDLIEKYLKVIKRIIDWLKPKLKWLMDNIIKPIGEKVGEAFLSICESIGEVLDVIYENCDSLFKSLDDWLWPLVQSIASFLRDVFLNVVGLVQGAVEGLLNLVKNIIPDFTGAFQGILDFISGVFTLDWEKAWKGIQRIFLNIFNGIISIFEGIMNLIIDGLNKISFDLPDFLGGAHIGFDFEHVHWARWEVPELAQGAVLPPNQPFLAMVGDQKQGTNVEAPLSTIQEAVANVLKDIKIKCIFDVQGDPNRIFKVVQKGANIYYNQYGTDAFSHS